MKSGIEVQERDLTLYDAYTAEEAFWTTTSYCILPIPCPSTSGRSANRTLVPWRLGYWPHGVLWLMWALSPRPNALPKARRLAEGFS